MSSFAEIFVQFTSKSGNATIFWKASMLSLSMAKITGVLIFLSVNFLTKQENEIRKSDFILEASPVIV